MKQKLLKAGFAGLVLLTGGCYEYAKPLADFSQSSYSQRPKEANADLFKGIKQLTLADAQRISITKSRCESVIQTTTNASFNSFSVNFFGVNLTRGTPLFTRVSGHL